MSINTSMKILESQAQKISKLLKDTDLGYTSTNDFVKKAVDKEIKEAIYKRELSDAGKLIFEDLFRHKRYEAFYEAKIITTEPSTHTDSKTGYTTTEINPHYYEAIENYRKAYTESAFIKTNKKEKK